MDEVRPWTSDEVVAWSEWRAGRLRPNWPPTGSDPTGKWLATLDVYRAEGERRRVDADRLADEVAVLVHRGTLDARSPAGDALLDYREPPATPRADRIVALEAEVQRLTEDRDEARVALRSFRDEQGRVVDEANRWMLKAAQAEAQFRDEQGRVVAIVHEWWIEQGGIWPATMGTPVEFGLDRLVRAIAAALATH